MENKKKGSLAKMIFTLFKSKVARNIWIIAIILVSVLCMFMMDESNIVRKGAFSFLESNFIASLMTALNIGRYNFTIGAWILFFCILLLVIALLIGNIFAKNAIESMTEKNQKWFKTEVGSRRFSAIIYYGAIVLGCAAIIFIAYMLGAFNQIGANTANIFLSLLYTVLFFGLFIIVLALALILVFYVIKAIVLAIASLVKNVGDYAKVMRANDPDRFFDEEEKDLKGDVKVEDKVEEEKDIFPSLTAIDQANEKEAEKVESQEIGLDQLALRFQAYAAKNHKIYYELPLIRSFIAGLSASRLLILEGLSGTGKSMLPRVFAQFMQSNAHFSPVQATWRDKTDVLGFYSEFTKTFKMTDFLRNLYSASYTDSTTLMVLDEMNLSRIEYYFADLLSVLEYPKDQWKIKVYDPELNQKLPAKLEGGYVTIPENAWFVGTANTDDSTFTITDKVYDRAITIDFKERILPIETDVDSDPIYITAEKLQQLFADATDAEENILSEEDVAKFLTVCDFMKEAFDLRFGNRIMVQIAKFVPVYVALGGTKEEALDFLFASKIMRKLNGLYDDYVKDELLALRTLLNKNYGKDSFKETDAIISKILKKLV